MNVLYTVDNNFVPQLAASICSICKNNTTMDSISFFVLADKITPENQTKLKAFVEQEGRTIDIIEISGFMESFGSEFDTLGWNEVIMARVLMDRFLPKDLNRVLYLDGDTIVRESLEELWATDLEGKILAAAMEPTVDTKRKEVLGLKGKPYYNSGVLLVDLVAWRSNNAEKRILDYCNIHREALFAPDQDAINAELSDSIVALSPAYNYANIISIYPYKMMLKLMDCYVSKSVYEAARNKPYIIHYLGEERPWRIGNRHEYREDYDRYLQMTPWADSPREQGWETYFAVWNVFNLIMKPIPFVRYKIINGLIPVFMKIRKRARTK